MVSTVTTHLVTAGLLAGGLAVCGPLGGTLAKDPELKIPLNPFGIKTSPFGEVLAMAMQGPVDVYWINASSPAVRKATPEEKASSFRDGARLFIDRLEKAAQERTNPNQASLAQQRFLRRQIEDKLRFAYELDPAHYGNYNAYHFFLTEPAVGTRRHPVMEVAALAERTINYCLSRSDDPRHALTAAAAAQNMLLVMFNDSRGPEPQFSTGQMRGTLAMLDHCLARYDALSAQWDKTGNWALLSDDRIIEAGDRLNYILNTRETSVRTIERLEKENFSPSAARQPSPTPSSP